MELGKPSFNIYTRANQVIVDGIIFASSFAFAYAIRFDGLPPWPYGKQFLLWLPYLLAFRLTLNWKLGIYRFVWRYVSLPDVMSIGRSLLAVTTVLLAIRVLYPGSAIFGHWVRLPLSIIALEFLTSLGGVLTARALRRILYERGQRPRMAFPYRVKRVLLYGAGRAGILLSREFANRADVEVVGFVDDDRTKVGTVISGRKVLGDHNALQRIIRELRVEEVVISIANANRDMISQILAKCEAVPVQTKIIPTLHEIIEGRVSISQVREVRIEDLLGRDCVEMVGLDEEVRQVYVGKRILVTGAGGSIGSELVRQLMLLNPSAVALLDKDENSTYELEQELISCYPGVRIEPQIADIRHRTRLDAIFGLFRPEVVFHAAAHKHVPLMERHPCEAILNNVYGTRILLDACHDKDVERFVFISTDKAVAPTSVMGATKRIGELLVRAYADGGLLASSSSVRFGNVMGSRGSVIPLFQKQIREGGPIRVTHPEVVRFFMTIPEAVQLVMSAGSLGKKGEIFVLDMGSPQKILNLANKMVRLVGLEPGKEIEIAITGLRPGEKLVEELTGPDETVIPTGIEKLSVVNSGSSINSNFLAAIDLLVCAAQENDSRRIYDILSRMGIGFSPHVVNS
jgi:FlaA1/EpsC-like NDP-sugar epimerase